MKHTGMNSSHIEPAIAGCTNSAQKQQHIIGMLARSPGSTVIPSPQQLRHQHLLGQSNVDDKVHMELRMIISRVSASSVQGLKFICIAYLF